MVIFRSHIVEFANLQSNQKNVGIYAKEANFNSDFLRFSTLITDYYWYSVLNSWVTSSETSLLYNLYNIKWQTRTLSCCLLISCTKKVKPSSHTGSLEAYTTCGQRGQWRVKKPDSCVVCFVAATSLLRRQFEKKLFQFDSSKPALLYSAKIHRDKYEH